MIAKEAEPRYPVVAVIQLASRVENRKGQSPLTRLLHVKAEYLKKGQWTPGHEATYHEDASARVIFK